MKIIPVNNYRNYQISNLTKSPKQNNVTFGHYLDDEKDRKQSRLSSLESDISRVDSRIWSENYDFERESSSLDSQIDSAENRLDETERRINNLRDRAASKESSIDSLSNEGYRLQQKAKKNLDIIKNLETEKQNTVKQLQESNTTLQNVLAEEFKTKSEQIESEFKKNAEEMQNGVKVNLIQKVINPIIDSMEGKEVILPSCIYIENSSETSEPIFSWLVKQTDSNYSKINTAEYSDKKEVFSLLKKISLLASRSYEETGKRTFTLISGFENIILPLKNNESIKELFLNAEKMYHNIIVVISKIPYSEFSKNIKFSDVITVEKNFLTNKKLGKDSLEEFVSKHQYTGENLLSKIIRKKRLIYVNKRNKLYKLFSII